MKFVLTNSFEQKCVFIHAFLNQVELAAQCSFIGINDEYFDSMCISNAKRLFSETVSPKIIVKYIWTEKVYSIYFLFRLLKLHLPLPQIPSQGNKYFLHNQM